MGFEENKETRSSCPFCCEAIQHDAVVCPHCRTILDAVTFARRALNGARRPQGWILGVCAETAMRSGFDASLVRIAFLGLTFLGGSGFTAYMVLWLLYKLVPADPVDQPCEKAG